MTKSNFDEELDKEKQYRGSVSRLRREITKLNLLTEPAARLLREHLDGKEVPKERITNAKWVLSTLREYYDTAIREENVKVKKLQAAPPKPKGKARSPEPPEEEEGQEQEQAEEQPEDKRPFSTKYEPPEEPKHDPKTDF